MMEEGRGERVQSAYRLRSLELPLTSFEFLLLSHLSVVDNSHGIVFDGGILVAAVVECSVLCLFGLDFDNVCVFTVGLGHGVELGFFGGGCVIVVTGVCAFVRLEFVDFGVVAGFAV